MNWKILAFSLTLACASAASATCPPQTTGPSNTPALDALKASAASGDMSSVTGDDCAQGPAATPAVKKDPAAQASAKKPPTPKAEVPSVTDQEHKSSGGFFSGFKKTLSDLPVNQTLAGVGFGGMVGVLVGLGGPVGWIGGALIGAVIGAVLFSGIIGKLMHKPGTGGS